MSNSVLSVSRVRPGRRGQFAEIAPGELWRSPAAYALAAVIQNTTAYPLFVIFADKAEPARDRRQFTLAPELTGKVDLT